MPAVGYGRFEIRQIKGPDADELTKMPMHIKSLETTHDNSKARSPLEKILDELKLIKPTDAGFMAPIVQKMENLERNEDKVAAATAFKEKLGKGLFKKSKFKSRIEALIRNEI